jgi:hypothetical protein
MSLAKRLVDLGFLFAVVAVLGTKEVQSTFLLPHFEKFT